MVEEKSYWQRFWRRRLGRRQVLKGAALGGAGLAAAAVIGCGEEEKPAATATPAPAATPTAPAATPAPGATATPVATPTPTPAVALPKRGGTLSTWYWTADLPGLDIQKQRGAPLAINSTFWYNRLLRPKSSPDDISLSEKWIPEPELASSYEVSDDAVTWSFKIRQGVKWQNKPPMNGRDFTIADVKFNVERFMAEAPGRAELVDLVDRVQYPDDQTLVFKLKSAYAGLDKSLSSTSSIFFLPPDVVEREGDATKNAVGTGPFILDRWEAGVGTFNIGNPDYFEQGADGKPLPYVDELHAFFYRDVATVVSQLRAGQLDVTIPNMAVDQVEVIQRSNPEIQWIVRPYWNQYNHAFSPVHYSFKGNNEPPFNDARVRRAVSMGVDRQTLHDLIYGGLGILSATIVPPTFAPHFLDPDSPNFGANAKYARYNLQEAKQLLAAAGYEGGFDANYYFNAAWAQGYKDEVEAIVGMLRQVGISAKAQGREYNDFIRNYLYFEGWGDRTGMEYDTTSARPDIHGWVFQKFSPDSPRNLSAIDDPKITPLVEKQKGILNEEERAAVVHEIQRVAVGQAYYPGWLQWPRPVAVQPWVKNFAFHHHYGAGTESYPRIWIDKA
ncbi:MAG: ABC transporter substrate-binding protein [Dehalococcoidia bacterium]